MYNQDLSRGSKSLHGAASVSNWEDPALKKNKGASTDNDEGDEDKGGLVRRHNSYLPVVAKSINSVSDVFMHKEQAGPSLIDRLCFSRQHVALHPFLLTTLPIHVSVDVHAYS